VALTDAQILTNLDQKRGKSPIDILRETQKQQPFISPVQGVK
jgi:hypothetical protein